MPAPRLEIDLDKIYHNARTLVDRLASRGISVTGVSKATLGSPEIAGVFLQAGVSALGDSRIENIEAMRYAQVPASMTMIRSPMLSQAERVVRHADVSLNTEIEVIRKLSLEAQKANRRHGVVLMVELGDLREGIMPDDLIDTVRETLSLPNIVFKGIGTNLACRSGVSPDSQNMAVLSKLVDSIEATFGLTVDIVSGGNSANIQWVFSETDTGRINDLRMGESILLGCEPLHRTPIDGLHTDAITLIAEVIESKVKPSRPTGEIGQNAFGEKPTTTDRGHIMQTILAIGIQDIDPCGLQSPVGTEIIGASSDHLLLDSGSYGLSVGAEMMFQLNYSALVRAMTSPFVTKIVKHHRASMVQQDWTSGLPREQ
ncbi:MAG: alanine/ornithine racemase family PLP-dependent enzyme [Candidatus Thiodiazotropha weberae]|uniref:Alanine racemase n=1 Tax=Candidatus Thiodiazotropha endoloripes TaxID=1818881 RepID=A0A1E2UUG4_9GAMM|nr:alanine/ornithine racemase family PLP-dependent enzyme [Candidatus Thiodiazotropha weberae]MCG7903346.1 alanine/ornithine racemase family PLP-dependent enzyme [Candidatus Thiodiazotropha weberae]ODB84786.1 alanine racemase [Candidatus Thiodiazotropha endoloripes]ODB91760.1 alanine racemase [Candidatus Thiodiazotropha endoloripes]ODB98400.1 alanine racemase [Candidatus Thiodiazotropha endoloripes]